VPQHGKAIRVRDALGRVSPHPLNSSTSEPIQQFSVDAAEAAVAEDADDVAALDVLRDVRDDGVHVREVGGVFAGGFQIEHQLFRVEAFGGGDLLEARDGGDDHGVGIGEGGGQFILKNIAARGVAAGLEDGPELLLRVFDAQGAQGFADGGRVVAEIIDDGDAAGDAANFHAAFDAFEGVEGGLDLFVREAAMFGAGDDGEARCGR